jgi:DNA-binding transcriptional LysR family regulator
MIDAALLPALFDVLTVARTGSVGQAARQLHKTASAVSQQIRRVERHFGVVLFERAGRQLKLSGPGELVLPAINRLFDEAQAAYARLAELAGAPLTVLRIVASDYVGRALLAPVIRELLELKTPLRFEITTTHSSDALRAVERGEADFAVATAREPRPALSDRVLLVQPFVWVAPISKDRVRRIHDRLLHEPLLRLSAASEGRQLLDAYLERNRIPVTSTIDVPSVSLMLSYVSGGLGIGLAPALSLDGALEKLGVEHADVGALPIRVAFRRAYRLSPVTERFVQRLLAEGRSAEKRLTGRFERA